MGNIGQTKRKTRLEWAVWALTLIAIIVAACLPLRQTAQQALIGIALIWFQASLMLGFFQ